MRKKTSGLAAMLLISFCILLAGRPVLAQNNGNGSGDGNGKGSSDLSISPATIPDGKYGAGFEAQHFKADGGKSPYTYAISGGGLPPGLSLSKDGVLSGSPSAAGGYAFTVTVQDNGKGKNAASGSHQYSLNINPAPLQITAANATMSQGGTMPALTVSYSGFVNGDGPSSLAAPPKVTTTATAASPAGTYPITVSGAVDANYAISYHPGMLTVVGDGGGNNGGGGNGGNNGGGGDPGGGGGGPGGGGGGPGGGGGHSNIVVTAQPETKTYGAADPALTYTVSGLPSGTGMNIFTGSLGRAAGENVGSYAITKGTLSAPGYSFSFTGNYLTITPATQQISWTQNLLVGCNSATQLPLQATASSGLPVAYQVSDPNVARVTGNVLTLLRPGIAVVTATQPGDANYSPAAAVTDTVVYQPVSLINQHWSDVIFFDNSGGDFVGWQWYKNGNAVPGATLPYYSESPSLDGQYFVMATNKAGEEVQSCTLTITGDSAIAGSIKVFPNPAKAGAQVTVTASYSGSALQGAFLQVVDLNGRVRQQLTTVQPSTQVTMPPQTGIYIINLLLPGGQKVSTNVLVD